MITIPIYPNAYMIFCILCFIASIASTKVEYKQVTVGNVIAALFVSIIPFVNFVMMILDCMHLLSKVSDKKVF